jgi:DNA-binding LytR/AlgR family response regulator
MISVFDSKSRFLHYIFVWIAYAAVHLYIYSAFSAFGVSTILIEACLYALLYAVTGILLMYILKYAGLGNLNVFQRNLNYFVLFVVGIALVVGLAFFALMPVSDAETTKILLALMPLRVFVSAIIYCLIVASFRLHQNSAVNSAEFENGDSETDNLPTVETIAEPAELIDRIAVKSGQKIHVIQVHQILYLQADSDYVHIFTESGKYMKEQTMKYFEEHLSPSKFVRVHRSCIVNVDAISRVELYEKQTQLLILKNGIQIKMSQAGYKLLKGRLKL